VQQDEDRAGRHLVALGDRRLAYIDRGVGQPVVILEAGSGGSSATWTKVIDPVAAFTRVIAYDRAGRGGSDPVATPRSSADVVADLHCLLERARIAGPYVLVAHSYGSYHVRLFAHRYPSEVAGVVFVDVVIPEYLPPALALLPPETPGESPEITLTRRVLTQITQGRDEQCDSEGMDRGACWVQVRACGSLGDRPLVVMTAGRLAPHAADFPADLGARLDALWFTMQRDLNHLSSRGTHILVAESGHDLADEQPAVIVSAIRQVVATVRSA
jgi:pimeloyl-ACP methyl ester carboxylesterase